MSEYHLEANARNWIVNQESYNSTIPYYALWREEDIECESFDTRMSWWKNVNAKFQQNKNISELAKEYLQILEDKKNK